MSAEPFTIEETVARNGARIVAIGVGGGGGNMINHMISHSDTGDIELIAANTDAQALETSLASKKLQLGGKLTKGLGAGMVPDVGRDSAKENYDEIKASIDGADIVFIAAGLGGGTGTGAAPVIAQIAKEAEALTISVVTKPFKFEGRKRTKLANLGLEELKKESDSIVVIPNEKLHSIVDRKLGIADSFKLVDKILAQAVMGTSGIILSNGVVNLDFADLKTVMNHKGMALMGVGEHQGENAAYEAVKSAIESPLLDNVSINGAMGILANFSIHPDYPLEEITAAMEVLEDAADEDADIIFGTSNDPDAPIDVVKVTLVATGFEKELNEAASINNPEFKQQPVQEATPQSAPTQQAPAQQKVAKVVGYDNEDYLDIPTYLRQKID